MNISLYIRFLKNKLNILDSNLAINKFILFIKSSIKANLINNKFLKQVINIKYLFNKNKIVKNYNSIKFNIYKQKINFNIKDIKNFYKF